MADEIDAADERETFELEARTKNICAKAAQFETGHPGECYFCGEEKQRVIQVEYHGGRMDACGRCRDLRGIK
jgi:hypothetical protein